MKDPRALKVWFVTGSQGLYGKETLEKVAEHSRQMVRWLDESKKIPAEVDFSGVATSPEEIREICLKANSAPDCMGLVLWMHTFSPAKMWIAGLSLLKKPFLHLHTQFNREIPWSEIDMDFMNLNQSAHGDREFGFIASRMRLRRKVVVGFWQDEDVLSGLSTWVRAARAWHDWQTLKIARFGDNMREVAVTEGDKVEAQLRFGYSVYGFGVGDFVECVRAVSKADIEGLAAEYEKHYSVAKELRPGGSRREVLLESARIERGLRGFLERGGFSAFTTTFEDLHGLEQLPGLAVQRLMGDGYGFGAEGDWKTAALVRAMKVMGDGLPGGASFMEDYTYHLAKGGMRVLGAHMLEVCGSIADGKPSLEVHPLAIGGKSDPPRLVFTAKRGPAVNATIVDMGDRFRMVVNDVEVVPPDKPLPKLPVARALWNPLPDMQTAAAAWILSGGAHHSGFSQAVTAEHLEDFAEMAGVEYLHIGKTTDLAAFKKELRWNDMYYHMKGF
jgi:L-arabinose isomerase